MNDVILNNLYEQTLNQIEYIIKSAKKYNKLDSQEFLDFLDKLNEYSIDPDRD